MFLERELDKHEKLCHPQASGTITIYSPTDLLCSILYRQQWRSYVRRELRGGERLFVLNECGRIR